MHEIGKAEKRPRFTKSQVTTTAAPRRAVLGDVTNRISIKKSSVSSMGSTNSSMSAAGALAKKKYLVNKRSINNVNVSSRSIRPLSATTPAVNTLSSLGFLEKPKPVVHVPLPTPKESHDIDSVDKHDPTMCWQYAEDITKYHLETEKARKPSSSYMSRQSDINSKMRAILVDWLVDVHCKYGLQAQTLHIAVHLIDRHLERNLTVRRQRLQLVGVAALFIASKYEEIYPPEAEDFVKITDNAYTREEVFKMESELLASVGYRVTFPTGFQFMTRFLKASRTTDDRVEHFAHYIVDRSLQEYKLIKYMPSTIAASAVHIARTQMRDLPAWSSTLEYHSSYKERSLEVCIEDLKEMLWNAQNGVGKMSKLTAVRRKFSKERFMSVSSHPLVLDNSP
ncbi:hypothetical protein BBJ28_00003866 [Nothophytophthora sp. Chile5]|nr:hypothetical protein BBJ28_00003866 [Nothophytophthora sp. Chile5]